MAWTKWCRPAMNVTGMRTEVTSEEGADHVVADQMVRSDR
jgi:hypothetical protein